MQLASNHEFEHPFVSFSQSHNRRSGNIRSNILVLWSFHFCELNCSICSMYDYRASHTYRQINYIKHLWNRGIVVLQWNNVRQLSRQETRQSSLIQMIFLAKRYPMSRDYHGFIKQFCELQDLDIIVQIQGIRKLKRVRKQSTPTVSMIFLFQCSVTTRDDE